MTTAEKFVQMFFAIALFVGVMALVLFIVDRSRGKRSVLIQSMAFVLPALLLLAVGLVYPAIRTGYESFFNRTSTQFVGLDNYKEIFTSPELLTVLRNTFIW